MELMQKPPSWNQIRANAAAFAARWADETDENAGSQSFWNEFLAIFGIDRKRVATFEARAQRASTGGKGRIDLLWPGVLVAEHKSAGKDLATAEDQAIDYLESIGDAAFPGHVITSDFARMRIRDLGGDNIPFEFPLKDLAKEIDRFGFIAGYSTRRLSPEQERQVDIAAAQLMAGLYEQLAATGIDDHEISVLLIRLLFLLFGDDTGLWERGLFLEFLETRTQPDGSDLGAQLTLLFQTLDRPPDRRPPTLDELLLRFPYVNGGLFADRLDIPTFTGAMRTALIECCHIDWGSIVPAIFGSLFQAVKSKEARRSLGEHYTSEANILRVIRPLFLDQLNTRLEASWHDARKLRQLKGDLGKMRFFDPACGCGNFLVIAYREMRRLELRILLRLRDLTGEDQLSLDPTLGLQVTPTQFYGIEIEEWPARIAETALFLVDHQANLELAREFGEAPDRLPISTTATIRIGNALDMDWAAICPPGPDTYVMGNPPFLGIAWMSEAQQQDNRRVFARLDPGGKRRTGRLDYVACWYAKAIEYAQSTATRIAFVSTNSISQGEQARALGPLLEDNGYAIDFAYPTFTWSNEAAGQAAVHVVIIGFSTKTNPRIPRIYDGSTEDLTGTTATNINIYLADGPPIDLARRSTPLVPGLPLAAQGNKPWDGGHLIVEPDDYDTVAADPIASKYLRPYRQASEMLRNTPRWCLWLVDAPPEDLRKSPILTERLRGVREARLETPTAAVRELADTPALFAQRRQPTVPFVAMPEMSSSNRAYIPGAIYEPDVIPGNTIVSIPGAPLWLFGILQSKAVTIWVHTLGGRMKSDVRFTPSLAYFSFPFPDPSDARLEEVDALARAMLDARAAHPTSSLADLYDPLAMPADLRSAHKALDKAVLALYGLKVDATDAGILTALITRYQELEEVNRLPLAKAPARKRSRAKTS